MENGIRVCNIFSKSLITLDTQTFFDVYLLVFMSASQQINRVRKLQFQSKQSTYHFQWVLSSVNIISQKNIIAWLYIWILDLRVIIGSPEFIEESHEVKILAMQRAENFNSRSQLYHHTFFLKNLNYLFAKSRDNLRFDYEIFRQLWLKFVRFQKVFQYSLIKSCSSHILISNIILVIY